MSSMMDRISTLPDDVLCHILSFLPTKHAVATGVLSKRWTHLWRSVLALDFSIAEEEIPKAGFCLNKIVSSVFRSRDPTLPIKSFRFEIDNEDLDIDFGNVNKWVNTVTQRGVECLHLRAFSTPELPLSILTCRTLVVLKFCGWFKVEGLSSVALPSLKILEFLPRYEKDQDINIVLLLNGCPNLEDLKAYCFAFGRPESESDTLRDSRTHKEWMSLSLSKLTSADIINCDVHLPLKAFYNVESLRIGTEQFMFCRDDEIPTFNNLTHLELYSLDCYGCNEQLLLIVQVLKHCPGLQNLEAHANGSTEKSQQNWIDPEFLPQCLSLRLRTCTIWNEISLPGALPLAIYVLKNARVLRTMTIRSTDHPEIFERELSSCQWASGTCQLSCSYVPREG